MGSLVTYDTLERFGFDALVVTKKSATLFLIDTAPPHSYEQYISRKQDTGSSKNKSDRE